MADIFSRTIQIDAELTPNETLDGELSIPRQVEVIGNYETLRNKPSINDVELTGNKTSSELGLANATHTHTKSDITDFTHTHTTDEITDFPTLAEVATSGDYDDLSNKPNLSEVATSGDYGDLSNRPNIPANTSDLTNDSGFISQETDPTVPSWAKTPTKPTYTANEVGALPNTTIIPSKTSDLINDSGFITGTSDYNALENKPSINGNTLEGDMTAEELGIQGEISQADLIDFGHTLAPVITDTAQGDIVSITDGAEDYPIKSLKVNLEPIQDLHGYDKPWVGGAGKNKIPYPYSNTPAVSDVTVTDNGDGTLTVNGTASSTRYYYMFGSSNTAVPSWIKPNTQYCANNIPSVTGFSVQFILYGKNGATTIVTETTAKTTPSDFTNYRCAIVVRIAAGTYNNVLIKPLLFEGVSLPNSWTPYSNICPISGHTECVTSVSGVNVWDEEWEFGGIDPSTGQPYTAADRIRSKNFIPILADTDYYYRAGVSGQTAWQLTLGYYDANKDFISIAYVRNDVRHSPTNAKYARFMTTGGYGNTYNNDISINYPSTDHEYHAFKGTTYTTDLGRTVYGGTLDVVSGELVVDRAMVTFDGTENWYSVDTSGEDRNRALYLGIDSPTGQYNWNLIGNYITPTGQADSYPQPWEANINAAGHLLIGIPKTIATITEWKAYLAQNPLQLCYELATPQTYQLDPQTISLLKGNNNVWSDGEVECEYCCDTKLYIDKKIGEI